MQIDAEKPLNVKTVSLQLQLPPVGSFMILGRVVIHNLMNAAANVRAELTNNDGQIFDEVRTRVMERQDGSPGSQPISLQAVWFFNSNSTPNIVQLRCYTDVGYFGYYDAASLFALQVDGLQAAPVFQP